MQHYRIFSGIAMLLLSTHYFMIGGLAAAIGCGLAVVRNIVSLRYNSWLVTGSFVAINIILMSWQFFYLEDSYNIFLAYAASIIFTIGTLRFTCVNKMRKAFISAEALSIVYAVLVGSIFGTVYSVLNISIIIWSLWQSANAKKNT